MTDKIYNKIIEDTTPKIINEELILALKKTFITENEVSMTHFEKLNQEKNNEELTPEKIYITEKDLIMLIITYSKIKECIIKKEGENISTTKTKYTSVLVDIWKHMSIQKILQTTTFNFKLTNENGEKGYIWCPDIGMSFQRKCAKKTLTEILNMVKVNKLTIKLTIKLETGRIINFKKE